MDHWHPSDHLGPLIPGNSCKHLQELQCAFLEWSPNGERVAGALDVDKEGLSVGAEGRTGELGAVGDVGGEVEDLATLGETPYKVLAAAVLADGDASRGAYGDVVRVLQGSSGVVGSKSRMSC